jgi:hypothetical protein
VQLTFGATRTLHSLMAQVVFDWLDETFAGAGPGFPSK